MDLQETMEKAKQELEKLPFIESTTSHITTDIAEIRVQTTNPKDFEPFARDLKRRPTQISILTTHQINQEEYQITIKPKAITPEDKTRQLVDYLEYITSSVKNYSITKH